MADKPFRVLLDLTDLYIENLKYVWINVSPRELKTIFDFKKSVLKKTNLEKEDIKLFVRDGLLLDDETVLVLREDDTVKVQYEIQVPKSFSVTERSEKASEKFSRKRNHSESNTPDMPVNSKKYKIQSDSSVCNPYEMDSGGTKTKKRKKRRKSRTLSLDSENCQSATLEESNDKVKSHKKKKKNSFPTMDHSLADASFSENFDSFFSIDNEEPSLSLSKSNVLSESLISVISTNNSSPKENELSCHQNKMGNTSELSKMKEENKKNEASNNNCPKKKRKRRRKRKQTSEMIAIDAPNNGGADNNFNSFPKSAESVERKHIVYSTSPNKIQDSCDSQLQLSASTFVKDKKCITKVQSLEDYPKISTPSQSDGCGNPNWHVSLVQTKSSISCSEPSSIQNEPVSHTKLVVKKDVSQIPNSNKNTENYVEKLSPKMKTQSVNKNESVLYNKSVSEKNVSFQSAKESKSISENWYANSPNLNVSTFLNGPPSSNGTRSVTNDKQIANKNSSLQSSGRNSIFSGEQYAELPPVNSLPRVGSHIVYKTLELDENYSPVISDYRKGIVKSINPDTEEIEIEFYEELVKPGRMGKFENLRDDEIPSPEINSCDVLKWTSIISPKYLP